MVKIIYVLSMLSFLAFPKLATSCTSFCLKNDSNIYLAKNLDWEIDNGFIFINERNKCKSILITDLFSTKEFTWVSKYRSLTFNQFGMEFPLGGINEHGLVIEELNSAPGNQTLKASSKKLNEFQLTQYILDNCSSIEEVKKQLIGFQYEPILFHLHYLIADKTGNVLIVEFDGESFVFHDACKTSVMVLSNNNYLESLKYLSKFKGFGGKLEIVNRPGSNERFISVSNMQLQYSNQPAIKYSFQILEVVQQKNTKWSLVYDIQNLRVHFKFHDCNKEKIIDLKKMLLNESIGGLGGNLKNCNLTNNSGLYKVSSKENTRLLQNVFSEISENAINYNLLYKMAILGNKNLKQSTPTEIVDELNHQILELPGNTPLNFPNELFDSITNWSNYKLVGLGEATHGTKEFSEIKQRLFKYLVEKHNYKILAYEYSFKNSLELNDFVLNGIGDIDSILSDKSWIQNNMEVKSLIKWMQSYNLEKTSDEKIHFIGIDNQIDAFTPIDVIYYIKNKYPRFIAQNNHFYSKFIDLNKVSYRNMAQGEYSYRDSLFNSLKNCFEEYLSTNQFNLSVYSEISTLRLIQSLINSHKFLYLLSKGENIRDKQLANNTLAIFNNYVGKNRIAVWAHNAHIANNPDYYGNSKASMGKYLKDKLGDQYYSIATSFSVGTFRAVMLDSLGNDTEPLKCNISNEPPFVSTNYILNSATFENFIFKTKQAKPSTLLYDYLNVKRPMIGVGDLYLGTPEKHFTNDRILNIIKAYDLLFYFTNTHPIAITGVE